MVLELGLVKPVDRLDFYGCVREAGFALTVYALDAERSVRRERVRARNAAKGSTLSMHVPDVSFDLASELWEPFDDRETGTVACRLIAT